MVIYQELHRMNAKRIVVDDSTMTCTAIGDVRWRSRKRAIVSCHGDGTWKGLRVAYRYCTGVVARTVRSVSPSGYFVAPR